MFRFLLKQCPRCRGDLQLQLGLDGVSAWSCIQCGYAAETVPRAVAPALAPVPIRSFPVTARDRRAS